MEFIMQISFNDSDYKKAVNFNGDSYFNNPTTLTEDDGKKLIIGAGTSDSVNVIYPYVLTVNSSLGYAGLERIYEDDVQTVVFMQDSQDFDDCKDFFDLDTKQQILFLSQWDNS